MTVDDFWLLIETHLDGAIDEGTAAALTAQLATRQPEDILAFADHLGALLYGLDHPEAAAQLVIDSTVGSDPFSMSDDLFLYARCAVVAAGRAAYERVLADPTQMAGAWPAFDGEHLLGVAPQAYETATGDDYDHDTAASDQTGTNAANWQTYEPEVVVAAGHLTSGGPWLIVGCRSENSLPWRSAHVRYQEIYIERITADPAWQTWWARSGIPALRLHAWLIPDGQPEHQKVKVSRKVAKLDLYLDGRFLLSTDRRLHFRHAKADLERLFQAAAGQLDLGPLPPFPAVPEPPIGVDMDQPELDDTEMSDRMWWTWMMQASGLNLGPA